MFRSFILEDLQEDQSENGNQIFRGFSNSNFQSISNANSYRKIDLDADVNSNSSSASYSTSGVSNSSHFSDLGNFLSTCAKPPAIDNFMEPVIKPTILDDGHRNLNELVGSSGPKKSSKVTQGIQTDNAGFVKSVLCSRHSMDSLQLNSNHQTEKDTSPKSGETACKSGFKQQFKRHALQNVNFSKWTRFTKKPSRVAELTEAYFSAFYKPFSAVRKTLVQQSREVLQRRYCGDAEYFEERFLKPVSHTLQTIYDADLNVAAHCKRQRHCRNKKKRIPGWPFCSRGYVIVQLSDFEPDLLKPGDFYFAINPETSAIALRYKTSRNQLLEESLNAKTFCSFMANMVSSENSSLDEEEEEKTIETDLLSVLGHLLVSVERGIQRIELGQIARDLWKWEGAFKRRSRHRSTRDSWVQTAPEELTELCKTSEEDFVSRVQDDDTLSVAPLASEEEFCSDSEIKFKQNVDVQINVMDLHCNNNSSEESKHENQALPQLADINEIDSTIVQSKVVLMPGCRDTIGRSVLFLSLENLRKHSFNCNQVAQLILYFQNIQKVEVMKLGFLVIIDCRDAAIDECIFLEKVFSILEASAPKIISLALTWQKQNQKCVISSTSKLCKSEIKFECVTNINHLLKYIQKNQLLQEFGGFYVYDHNEWINFHKLLDPFVAGCHMSGCRLLAVMQELRNSQLPNSSSLNNEIIEKQRKQIMNALEDEQLQHVKEEGDKVIEELEVYGKKSPQNHDYRDSIEKCGSLYKQLKKILQRLTKLADKRLGRLQEYMMLKSFEEESNQVLSWLYCNGEETLKRHKKMAENFSGIKEQENEFEKFYFLAMRQIERGNDLLEEVPKPKVVSSANIEGMTSLLKSQLDDFSERLEDAREKLEDTSQCYNLLDKVYEWALETMRFVSQMRIDATTTSDKLLKISRQIENYLHEHPPISNDVFDELISLAKKLKNERLIMQSQTAKIKCQETVELVHARQNTLQRAREQMEEKSSTISTNSSSSVHSKPFVWMPVISNSAYKTASQGFLHGTSNLYGSQNILREPTRSYTSFPSSYYPISTLKENISQHFHNRRERLMKDNVASDNVLNQRHENISKTFDTFNIETKTRKSYPFYFNDLKNIFRGNNGHKDVINTGLMESKKISDSSDSIASTNLSFRTTNWNLCEDALKKVADEVREQNIMLEKEALTRTCCDSAVDESIHKVHKSQKPAPVNMHLLRCASCSDFEELLSSKNAELEAEKKSKKMLKLIMREMIQTERDYVKSLEYIIENYIPLLLQNEIPQALRGQRNVLFGNIEKIYEFHNCYFLKELELCESCPYSVGQCFLKYEPQFYLYALYNKNKPKSDSLMSEYGSSFFKKKQQELNDKMDLASYLLKPVQRMGKYALLLKQLLKECPEGHNDYSDLKAAEEMVHFQLRHGNDLLAMDALRDCDVNVKEQGRLLRQDEFLVWQGKSRKALRHVFLFEDLILFSKARRDREHKGHDYYQYKYSIKTSDIGLTAQVGESPMKFEIWFRKRKVHDIYTLQAPSSEVRQAWVQDISKLLWKQAVRNRELRLAEMSSMGIGSKPCLDISPSRDQICDRSISLQQLNKTPRFRNSIAITGFDSYSSNKRPHSIISVGSSSSSSSHSSNMFSVPSNTAELNEREIRRRSMAQQSLCSAESGIFTDVSMSGENYTEHDYEILKIVERSNSVLSQASFASVASDTNPVANDSVLLEEDYSTPLCGKEA